MNVIMSDQEVRGKKSVRGRGRSKTSASSSSSVKETEKNNGSNQRSSDSKKVTTGKKSKGLTIKGLKLARGRGRIRIEDSSSDEDEEIIVKPKVEESDKFETINHQTPSVSTFHPSVQQVKSEKLTESEEKVSDENYINRLIKTEKLTFPEVNHLSLIHTTQTSSYDLVDDIAPSLSFVGPRANIPLHNNKPLAWNHKVNLIGDKCPSPRIHICEKCERPILLYGRLIPCKHVFCYDCAKANPVCLRCTDKVARVEKNKLGAVFMCTYENCRRTYLSHRDLQAHVSHRHLRRSSNQLTTKQSPQVTPTPSSSLTVASPSTSIGSSSMKSHSFSSRTHKQLVGMNFTSITSRATTSSSYDDRPTIDNDRKLHHHHLNSQQHHPSPSSSSSSSYLNSKMKAPNATKNLLITGKSPNLTSPSIVNLPRNWSTSGQPSSTISSASSSSFTSPTLPSSLTTNSWNLPLLSDPRQTINRHFYQ